MKTIEQAAQAARELVSALGANDLAPCCRMDDSTSCIREEGARPLTRAERGQGWAQRPFYAYDPAKLCNACLAYWHLALAAQALHELHCHQRREQARRCVVAADQAGL